jgi:hypothetical protein
MVKEFRPIPTIQKLLIASMSLLYSKYKLQMFNVMVRGLDNGSLG